MPSSVWLLLAVLAPLISGLLTLFLPRKAIALRVLIAAAGMATAFGIILDQVLGLPSLEPATAASAAIPWIPMLELNIAFLTDGLGAFFALLVAGVGFLIVLYARGYFGPAEDDLYRFYPTLGFFATAMLGVVLADYMLLTLLFWETTSISSFLLIGWDRYDKKAVKLAMQAFFTTGLGGMFLFGGILMFGISTDVWRWSELLILPDAAALVNEPGVIGGLLMMFIGAFTKSAQFPFHYWLPGAMAAPTPVSAYLHSATMVKAGVYLVGRLFPVMSASWIWPWVVIPLGALTMVYAAIVAVNQHDLKRIFAYTTVSQLGLLMCMYGLGGLSYEHLHAGHLSIMPAIDWDITQIANHAFYKAPLFIIAGALGHVLSRDITQLNGAFWKRPAMCGTMILAGYGLAAGPGTISFQAKEFFLYAIYHAGDVIGSWWIILMAAAVTTAICNVAIFTRLTTTLLGLPGGMHAGHAEHHDDHAHAHHEHHDSPLWASMMWVPALVLVVFQYVGGIAPAVWDHVFLPLETNLHYFEKGVPGLIYIVTHWSVVLSISLVAFATGVAFGFSPMMRGAIVDVFDKVYPGLYWLSVTGGRKAFGLVQTGSLRSYMVFTLAALLIGFTLAAWKDPGMVQPVGEAWGLAWESWPGVLLGLIVCVLALALPMTERRNVRVLILGSVGMAVVALYLIYQAPDLALTQLMVEIISVLLFVLVLRLLPRRFELPPISRAWRVVLGAAVGVLFGWMTIVAAQSPRNVPLVENWLLGEMFARHSYAGSDYTAGRGGGGDNVVNVILVDFRGFDTLGEITVLALAGLGVWSLVPRRRRRTV